MLLQKMSRELTSISSDVFTGVIQGGWCMSWKTVWEILAVHVAGGRCPIEGQGRRRRKSARGVVSLLLCLDIRGFLGLGILDLTLVTLHGL